MSEEKRDQIIRDPEIPEIFSYDDFDYSNVAGETKICKACGKPFIPIGKRLKQQQICKRTHYRVCPICGREYKVKLSDGLKSVSRTCSSECRRVLRSRVNSSPEVLAKSRATNLRKYGVENGAQTEESRKKISEANSKPLVELTCEMCGKKFYIHRGEYRRKCCSPECTAALRKKHGAGISKSLTREQIQEKIKRNNIKKYGVEWPQQLDSIKQKISDTNKQVMNDPNMKDKIRKHNQDRYGVDTPSQLPEVKSKISDSVKKRYENPEYRESVKQAQLDKFDGHWASQTEEFKERVKQTNIAKYGTEYASQSDLIKNKIRKSTEDQYGVSSVGQVPEFAAKAKVSRRKTMRSKYSVEFPLQNPEFHDKYVETMNERYGVDNPLQNEDIVHRKQETIHTKSNDPNISESDLVSLGVSRVNQAFKNYLNQHNISTEYEYPIDNRLFDLKIYDKNILVEIDPTWTHAFEGNQYSNYSTSQQLQKTLIAEKNGYRCIHVFDWDDWKRIRMLLEPQVTVGARKCKILEVDQRTANDFTQRYHIQGKCNGQKLNFGLYYNNEMIEIMTFGTPRYARKYKWELLRLCTKTGITVAGGASKLFKHALKTHPELDNIISYCDRAKFNGKVYSMIGMTLVRTTEPQEIWSHSDEYITANMLRARGYDQLFNEHYGKGTSNHDLMLQRGWLPVYDCGQFVFEYKRKDNI